MPSCPKLVRRGLVVCSRRYYPCFLLLALGACASPSPGTRPSPIPPQTITLPPTSAPSVPALSRTFSYTPGEQHYVLTTDATLSLESDSTPSQQSRVGTRVLYTVLVDTSAGHLRLQGSIDSFTVERGNRVPRPAELLPDLPLRWNGSPIPEPRALFDSAHCSIVLELIQTGQELLPDLPRNLPDGYRWRENTTLQVCRAGIPVTVTAIHEYRVTGLATFQGDSALQITRTTTATLAGQRKQGDVEIVLSGSAGGFAQIYVDLPRGQLLARTEQARSDLSITTPRGQTRLRQDLRSQLTRTNP